MLKKINRNRKGKGGGRESIKRKKENSEESKQTMDFNNDINSIHLYAYKTHVYLTLSRE